MQRLCLCRNSIGSSIVMMWSVRVRLISSISDASVVDLPEPVGPVTRTRPRGLVGELVQARRQAELLERANVRGDEAERAGQRLALVIGVDAEARQAAQAVREVELAVDLQPLLLLGRRDPVDQVARRCPGRAPGNPRAARCAPCRRTAGRDPAVRCRSEASNCTTRSSSVSTESGVAAVCSESSTGAVYRQRPRRA